jgi:SAM-dependent methyltransferase
VDATYGAAGLRQAFERIVRLPAEKSDNTGRVRCVVEFANRHFGPERCLPGALSVLDVGSGLCVFLHLLRQRTSWRCTALDPDARAAAHARDVAGVDAIAADFMGLDPLPRYDMLTFNKVLEHVVDPVAMLRKAAAHLQQDGVVYIELPDGEAAAVDGPGREEFFIDHHHIFSFESMRILAQRAGFEVLEMERLREPSSKFTLRGFLAPQLSAQRQTS